LHSAVACRASNGAGRSIGFVCLNILDDDTLPRRNAWPQTEASSAETSLKKLRKGWSNPWWAAIVKNFAARVKKLNGTFVGR
jgi:hypothetical protein